MQLSAQQVLLRARNNSLHGQN